LISQFTMARSAAFAVILVLCLTQALTLPTGGGFRSGGSFSAPRMSSPSISRPSISAPRPSISAPRPSISAPRPSIPAHRPSIPTPRPSIPAPKPVANIPRPTPKPVTNIPRPTPKPVVNPTPRPVVNPTPRPVVNPTPRPVTPTPTPSSKPNPGAYTPTNVYQANPAWKDMKLGNGQTTIGKGGCAISSLAAMADKAGVKINGAAPNTLNMNNWLKENGGFSGSLVNWGAMSKLGFKPAGDLAGSNKAGIIQGMGQGKSAVLNVGGHYVYATGSDATGFTVVDPGHQYKNHYTFDQIQSAKMFTK
jgi:outer membrane biosynthesis protein TonB